MWRGMEGQMADPWMRLTTYSLARHAKTHDIGGRDSRHATHTAIVKKKVNVSLKRLALLLSCRS